MTADAEGVLLRPAVRDIRVFQPREMHHPEFGAPFTGVLGLDPRRTDWPASGLSFLRLIPHLLPTIREMESRSSADAAIEAIDEEADHDGEDELLVRDLLTQTSTRFETGASLRDGPTAHLVHRVGPGTVSGPARDDEVTRPSGRGDVDRDAVEEVTHQRFPRRRSADRQPWQAPKEAVERSRQPHREDDPSERDPGHTGASRRVRQGRNQPQDTSEGEHDEGARNTRQDQPRHDNTTDEQSSERTEEPSDRPTQRRGEGRHAIRRDRPTSGEKSIQRESSEFETEERPRDTVAQPADQTDAGSRAGKGGDRRDETGPSRSESGEDSDLTVRRQLQGRESGEDTVDSGEDSDLTVRRELQGGDPESDTAEPDVESAQTARRQIRHQRPETYHREDDAWSVVDLVQRAVPTIRPDDIQGMSADRPPSLHNRGSDREWAVHRRIGRPPFPDSDDPTGGSIGPEPPGMVTTTSDPGAPLSNRPDPRDQSNPTAGSDAPSANRSTPGSIGMGDPPTMKPLRAGLAPPGHLEQASGGGPSPGDIASSPTDGPSTQSVAGIRTRNRTQSQPTQTNGDLERVNRDRPRENQNPSTRSEMQRIEDIIDINRLADRLTRILDRRARIERERRGR